MADARQKAEWERTSWLMAWVGRFSGGPFEPDKLNPTVSKGDRPEQSAEPSDAESAQGWAMLEAFFVQQAKDRAGG